MINKPRYILIHCTDVSSKIFDQFKSVNQYHKDRVFPKSSLGYYVGYHVLITGGKAVKCKEDFEEGAHTNQQVNGISMNFQSLAVCMGFDGDVEMPDPYMVQLMWDQVYAWQKKYNIPNEDVKFHRDYATSKTCPGSLITRNWLDQILHQDDVRTMKEAEQQDKQRQIVEQIGIIQRLIDALRQVLWIQFGIR